MAVNKTVNKSTKTLGAMMNVINYVMQDKKVREGFVFATGPFPGGTISPRRIYDSFLAEKRLWNKVSGRMYAHNLISFHKDEKITPEMVLEIALEFVKEFFPGHQCLICVHQDRDHLHCHIITNTVSFIDGYKLHQTKHDLQRQKDYTNFLCLERGLSVPKKGYRYDGSKAEEGRKIAWQKEKYNLIKTDHPSYLAECAAAVKNARDISASREEFIDEMALQGWKTTWQDDRKHIVFENAEGKKVRDNNISSCFSMDISKESLSEQFMEMDTIRRQRRNSLKKKKTRPESETANDLLRIKTDATLTLPGLDLLDDDEKPTIDTNTDIDMDSEEKA